MNDVLGPREEEVGVAGEVRVEEPDRVRESDFEKNRAAMISYLKDDLRRVKNRASAERGGASSMQG